MNAIMHANHSKVFDHELNRGCVQYWITSRFRVPRLFWSHSSAIRRGRDPTRV